MFTHRFTLMRYLLCLTTIVVIGFSRPVFGMTLRQDSIKEEAFKSDIIAFVTIQKSDMLAVGGIECATRYSGKVIAMLKNKENGLSNGLIEFGRYSGLDVGRTYILFLKKEIDVNSIYDNLVSKGAPFKSKESAVELIRCNGTVPGLIFDFSSAWELVGDKIIIEGQLPADLPDSLKIEKTDKPEWFINRNDISAYISKITDLHSP